MRTVYFYTLFLMTISSVIGCKSTPNVEDYENRKIMWPEGKSISNERKQVLIMPSQSDITEVKDSNTHQALDGKIAEMVVNSGAEIIDRKLQSKLLSEISKCERIGRPLNRRCFKSKVPDIIISTQTTGLHFSSSFSKSRKYEDKKGKTHYVPSRCTYKAELGNLVNIYKLVELQLQEAINIKGNNSVVKDSRNSNCPFNRSLKNETISLAVTDAMRYYGSELKSALAPQASILEYRWGNEASDNIFRLSIGKSEGAHSGLEVIIIRPSIPLTNQKSQSKYFSTQSPKNTNMPIFTDVIARGTIIEVNSQYSEAWIQIKSRKAALNIEPNDTVKIIYPKKACRDKFYKKWCEIF